MGYKVPEWQKSIGQNMFDVEIGDKTFQLVKAEYLTGDQVARLQQVNEIDGGIYTVLDEICEGLGAAFRPVPMKFVNEFVQTWQKDSAISLGESSASANS